jgi:hypothetical protein
MPFFITTELDRKDLDRLTKTNREFAHIGKLSMNKTGIMVVASEGGVDWAAYWGPRNWEFDRIKNEGDKLSEESARALFPLISSEHHYGR